MIPRTALLAVMESEAAHKAVSKPWASEYWLGNTPQIITWRGLAAILEPNRSERHLVAEWRGIFAGQRACIADHGAKRKVALTRLSEAGTVLPAQLEHGLTPARARLFLAGNAPMLRRVLTELRGLFQFDLHLTFGTAGGEDGIDALHGALPGSGDQRIVQLLKPFANDCRVADEQITGASRSFSMLIERDLLPEPMEIETQLRNALPDLEEVETDGPTPALAFRAAGLSLPSRREIMKSEILLDLPAVASSEEIGKSMTTQLAVLDSISEGNANCDLRQEKQRAARFLKGLADARERLRCEGIEADPWDIPQLQILRGRTVLDFAQPVNAGAKRRYAAAS